MNRHVANATTTPIAISAKGEGTCGTSTRRRISNQWLKPMIEPYRTANDTSPKARRIAQP